MLCQGRLWRSDAGSGPQHAEDDCGASASDKPALYGWLLVPLLLLAIRPVTTLAAFARSSVPVRERALIGWFGIRGIGSLYYVAAIIDERVLTEAEAKTVFWTVIALAGVSILAHGLTATSLTRRVAAPGAMES